MEIVIGFIAVLGLIVVGVLMLHAVAHLMYMLVAGIVIGALARFVLPGRQDMGLFKTALAGIGGSMAGGIVSRLMHVRGLPSLAISVACAAGLIYFLGAAKASK